MSNHAQLAFSKNFTLQKQLEDKYLVLRRTFKHSRRRLDTVEEECVAALYKLLMYAREREGLSNTGDVNIFNDLLKKPKSAGAQRSQSAVDIHRKGEECSRRPATAMSSKAYTQSFSFVKDGLNIDKTRRDRFMRTKSEKEREKENNVKVERLTDNWQLLKMNRPMTAVEHTNSPEEGRDDDNDTIPLRPNTAFPQASRKPRFTGHLSRPRTGNTLRPPQAACTPPQRSCTPFAVSESRLESPSAYTYTEEEHGNGELSGSGTLVRAHTQGERLDSPCLKSVHESRTKLDGNKSPLVVRITTTRLNDTTHCERKSSENEMHTRPQSILDNSDDDDEDELVPLDEEDQNKLNELVNINHNHGKMFRGSPFRPATSIGISPSRNASSQSTLDGDILRKSTQKTQSFLTEYSKKSKIMGYVMKTRSSIVAPRERIVSHRSPCITYQELASIKAGIKQHESKTRSLIQRSAKLSTYVDKLATAGKIRERLQELKQNNSSG